MVCRVVTDEAVWGSCTNKKKSDIKWVKARTHDKQYGRSTLLVGFACILNNH